MSHSAADGVISKKRLLYFDILKTIDSIWLGNEEFGFYTV